MGVCKSYLSFLFLGVFFFLMCPIYSASSVHSVWTFYNGNHELLVSKPSGQGPFPVIIYHYDEFLDFINFQFAKSVGYDLDTFIREFERWGCMVIVPIHRDHKVSSVAAGLQYALKTPEVDTTRIFVVGMGEGAFLSLLESGNARFASAMVLISPSEIDDSGAYSLVAAEKNLKGFKSRVLFMSAKADKKKRKHTAIRLLEILEVNAVPLKIHDYPVNRKWFWDPSQSFIREIYTFLFQKPYPAEVGPPLYRPYE